MCKFASLEFDLCKENQLKLSKYPNIEQAVLKILSMFESTYVCESSFYPKTCEIKSSICSDWTTGQI